MNRGDKIRNMTNAELAREIFRWHDILFGNEFRFAEDIERYLNEETEECYIRMLTNEQKELIADEEFEIMLNPNDNEVYIYSNRLDAFYPTELCFTYTNDGDWIRDAITTQIILPKEHLKGHWCFGVDLEDI